MHMIRHRRMRGVSAWTWQGRLALVVAVGCCVAAGVAGLVTLASSHQAHTALASGTTSPGRVTGAASATPGQAAAKSATPEAAASASGSGANSGSASAAAPASALPAAAANAKKGVAAWSFNGVSQALTRSGASWYYTWSTSHQPIATPRGLHFVPMIWGPASVTAAALSQAKHQSRYLLGFNEPDMSSQSNMSVAEALRLWPRLMSTGMQLGSPAVADAAATPGSWLALFMRGAKARGYRVNFITVHWYGGDFATSQAVPELRSYLQAIHARYHRPIWLTEFALIRFGSSVTFPSPARQAAFIASATSMLEHLSYVQRYAWFALPAISADGSAGLFRSGAAPTAAGRAFEAVDAHAGA
jgi:Glycosyl hydrolase catalytic core